MDFLAYQNNARRTRAYSDMYDVVYPALGLAGEAGEVANKVKKVLRDSDGKMSDEMRKAILNELGDCLWYIAALCDDLKANLNDLAWDNLDKLQDRKSRQVIGGSGDQR